MALWDVVPGTPVLPGIGLDVASSPDGAHLAVVHHLSSSFVSNTSLTVVDTSDWSEVTLGYSPSSNTRNVAFSPDGTQLAVGQSNVDIVSTADWTTVVTTLATNGSVDGVAFSSDGAYLAVVHVTSPRLTVFDTSDWSVVTGTPSLSSRSERVEFSPDGANLAIVTASGDRLTVLDTSDWTAVVGVPTLPSTGRSLAFSADGTLLAVGHDGGDNITVLNTADWTAVSGLPAFSSTSPRGVDFDPDGDYLITTWLDSPRIVILDTSDWSVVPGVPDLPGTGYGVSVTSDRTYTAISHQNSPRLTVLSGPAVQPNMTVQLDDTTLAVAGHTLVLGDMPAVLGDTQVAIAGHTLVLGDMAAALEGTQASFVGGTVVSGDMPAVLGDTQVTIAGTFVIPVADIAITLGDTRANIAGAHGPYALITLEGEASSTLTIRDIQQLTLRSLMLTDTETFYNPQEEVTAQAAAELLHVVAYIEALTLDGTATLTADTEHMLLLWLEARAAQTIETNLQRIFEDTLAALAGDEAVAAAAALISEVGSAEGSVVGTIAIELMDELAAQLTVENVMFVSINETLEAEAGDSVQALGHYSQNVKGMAGAWLVFKVSGEVIQGWVMNLEGERPFSQYSEFDFNSMTRIGNNYFAATDDGLYKLGGDTDAGSEIDAHIRSMMLDFGTTAQKRVVAAYLGYTSSGTVVLKVRSVDDGRLVEHWYEAVEVTAEAPRAGYRPLGRGLKSRYWQFELANVDGADFEIDKLELQPIQLSRRV